MSEVLILNQLLQIIKQFENIGRSHSEGDIYGLIDHEGKSYILSAFLTGESSPHDPKVLLPASFVRIGKLFFTDNHALVSDFCSDSDSIVISYSKSEGDLKVFANEDDGLKESECYSFCSEKEIYDKFIVARVSYEHEFTCINSKSSISKCVALFREQTCSRKSFFRMKGTDTLFQNDDAGIIQFNSSNNAKLDRDTSIGSLISAKSSRRKKEWTSGNCMDDIYFHLMINKSAGFATAPVAQCTFSEAEYFRSSFRGEAVTYICKDTPLRGVGTILAEAVENHLQLVESWLHEQAKDKRLLNPLKSYSILHFLVGYFLNLVYPSLTLDEDLKEYRTQIHKRFMFQLNRPFVRKGNKYEFASERTSAVLVNPHDFITSKSEADFEVGTVKGFYGYHHYMQDDFDDNKWGCAYRSLQTLISWFRHQGYTDKLIPTHRDIQKTLVDIKDKPSTFLGSKQWIGSTEVGFFLENYLNVSSKFIFVGSGAELADKGRELLYHFNVTGTPIMIGGGVLAHTILGVRWNSFTGDIKFLVLDPHYIGEEDVGIVVKNGWCGWKGLSFWNKNAFYNLCLPLAPADL